MEVPSVVEEFQSGILRKLLTFLLTFLFRTFPKNSALIQKKLLVTDR